MKQQKRKLLPWIAATILMVMLCVAPLLLLRDSEFAGADAQAGELVTELVPGYQPWIQSWWTPPGSETESLLFCLQAALGSGVFCFCAGYLLAKKQLTTRMNKQEN